MLFFSTISSAVVLGILSFSVLLEMHESFNRFSLRIAR